MLKDIFDSSQLTFTLRWLQRAHFFTSLTKGYRSRSASLKNCHSLGRSDLRPSLWRDSLLAAGSRRRGNAVLRQMIFDAIKEAQDDELLAACEAFFQAGGTHE